MRAIVQASSSLAIPAVMTAVASKIAGTRTSTLKLTPSIIPAIVPMMRKIIMTRPKGARLRLSVPLFHPTLSRLISNLGQRKSIAWQS